MMAGKQLPAFIVTTRTLELFQWQGEKEMTKQIDCGVGGKATLTSCLILGSSKVLRSLRHHLRAQSQGHHTIDRV